MSRRIQSVWAVMTSLLIVLTGCHPSQPFYLFEDGDLSHYVDKATHIDYPDTDTTSLADVENAQPPLTVENAIPKEFWDVSLEQCVKIALDNSKVMRTLGGRYASSTFNSRAQTGEPPDALLTAPDNSRSVYDPAIVETTPFTGTEYALSAFDAQATSSIFWQHNERPQNVNSTVNGRIFNSIFLENNSTFQAGLSKTNATGGTWTLSNNTFYDQTNNPTWAVPSTFATTYQAAFNQPLLQGAGVMYNRIAGPYNPFQPTATGLNTPQFDGVMLARINVDISLADFEGGVRNLVYDVENAYWELYFAYRALEANKTGRDSALQSWQKIHALYVVGARGGEAEKEAQSRAQYFLFRGQVQTYLNDLFRAENRLRYVIGIGMADGRLMRPADEPTTAEVTFDWREVHSEAIARSVELRRQKWRIKERELEIIAAKSNLQPRLDASGYYQWYGLGDTLLPTAKGPFLPNVNQPTQPALYGTNSYSNLFSGGSQSWQLGLNYQMTLGFRAALSTLRFYQLNMAKEKARLQDQELEVSHQMGDAIRNLEYNYNLSQTNFNRRVATERQVEAVRAAFDAETVTLDLLLDAQRQRAEAEVAYFRSLVDYQRGVAQVHYRKGSILEYDGVYLAEGPWPAKAQFDAHRLARQRDASFYLNYGFTRPKVISRGPYLQNGDDKSVPGDEGVQGPPQGPNPTNTSEELPMPVPVRDATTANEPISGERLASATVAEKPAAEKSVAEMPVAAVAAPATKAAGDSAWSGLGLKKAAAKNQAVAAAKRADQDTHSGSSARIVAVRDVEPASATSSATAEQSVQKAVFQWKPSTKHEPREDQPAGAANRDASGWQGTQR